MKSILLSFLCIIGMLGCQKESVASSSNDYAELSIDIKCNAMEVTKKLTSQQDQEIRDVNIYLFNRRLGIVKRQFSSSKTLSFNIPKGEYDIYTFANYGYDLGDKTKSEIEDLKISIQSETDLERSSLLLMSVKQNATISNSTSLSVVLKRLVAQINVDINISSDFDFTVNTISVKNAPVSCNLTNGSTSQNGFNYKPHNKKVFDFYLFENLQGVNNSITDQRHKTKDNAPPEATYIHIIGSCESKKVEYSIYLGENNTTDFNVYRNKNYSYIINIKGVNDIDNRVNIAALTLTPLDESYKVNNTATSTINLTCTENSSSKYWIAYYLLEGEGSVSINGTAQTEGVFMPFLNYGESSNNATLTYTQSSISAVRIKIVAKDQSDFTFSREIFTNYMKPNDPLKISSLTSSQSRGGSESQLTFFAEKKDYTEGVQLKYELLSGTGTIKYKGITLNSKTYTTATLGTNSLSFTPTEPTDALVKITMKLADGETQTAEIAIRVTRITIAAYAEGWRAGGEILFYVDNVENGILPTSSCEKFEITRIYDLRHMTYPYIIEHNIDQSTDYQIIRPNKKLFTNYEYFGSEEEEGSFTCSCHGYTYKFRVTTIKFEVYSPNKFFDFKFYYD